METENVISCVNIETVNNPLLNQVEKTYLLSFPESERREFELLKQLIAGEPRFRVNVLLKNNEYAGFITSWDFPEFSYVEHFAIDESARNGGIGGKAMQHYLNTNPLPVVLEVEQPEDEMSKRRIVFYQRLGFKLDHHAYRQPPYRPGGEWLDLVLMSYGNIDLDKLYEDVKNNLYIHVYNVVEPA